MAEPVYVMKKTEAPTSFRTLGTYLEGPRGLSDYVVLEIAEFERLKADAERLDFLETIYQQIPGHGARVSIDDLRSAAETGGEV